MRNFVKGDKVVVSCPEDNEKSIMNGIRVFKRYDGDGDVYIEGYDRYISKNYVSLYSLDLNSYYIALYEHDIHEFVELLNTAHENGYTVDTTFPVTQTSCIMRKTQTLTIKDEHEYHINGDG